MFRKNWIFTLFLSLLFLTTSCKIMAGDDKNSPDNLEDNMATIYIGTYTNTGSLGIYIYEMNLDNGGLEQKGFANAGDNPSYLSIAPNKKYLYAVNEAGNQGGVTAFAIDSTTHLLRKLNTQPSHGAHPCFVTVDKTSQAVLIANYTGGNVASYQIQQDGKLSEAVSVIQHKGSSVVKNRQGEPHAHSINISGDNNFAYAADLGTDDIFIYNFDAASGELTETDRKSTKANPGAGPRHMDFHPTLKIAYAINELDATISVYEIRSSDGYLIPIQTVSTLPVGYSGQKWCADIHVHPNGEHVYGSNRGHNSIAIFSVDQETGKLTATGHESTGGNTPRNFAIDPTGSYILAANQDSDNIVVLKIDENGDLAATGQQISIPKPVCVKFVQF